MGDMRMQDFFIALRTDIWEVRLGKYLVSAQSTEMDAIRIAQAIAREVATRGFRPSCWWAIGMVNSERSRSRCNEEREQRARRGLTAPSSQIRRGMAFALLRRPWALHRRRLRCSGQHSCASS